MQFHIQFHIHFHIPFHIQFRMQFRIQFHIQCLLLLLIYLLLSGNFTPIPQIYTHRAKNPGKKISQEIVPVSRKFYIVCKLVQKMVLLGFWSLILRPCDNQLKFQSYSTNPHTKPYHSGKIEFLKILSDFQENLHCVQNCMYKIWFCWDFEVLPPGKVTFDQNFSPNPQIYTPNPTILPK